MYKEDGNPTVTNCSFSDNTSNFEGGGMYNGDSDSNPTVTHCTFSGNSASTEGGGMFNNDCNPTVTHCTFSGNSADFGAGMYNVDISSNLTITNCSFSGNTANFDGGGIFNIFSTPTVTNSILWGNTGGQIFDSFGSSSTVSFSNVQGGLPNLAVDGGGNIDINPLFVSDPDDGGDGWGVGDNDDYGDLRLQVGSPCIDAGDNTAVPIDITTDLDYRLRFVDVLLTIDTGNGGPPTVDMGAYEYACTGNLDAIADVALPDFALFALQWLQTDCGLCGGADFTGDNNVLHDDLEIMAANWLCGTGP